MKRIRYLSLLTMLLFSVVAWGQDEFNPASPAEPGAPASKLTVKAEPSDGGSVSGGGKYTAGANVSLRATSKTGYVFVNWTNADGDVVSTTSSFTHVKGEKDEEFTAHFEYIPSSPSEPKEPSLTQYFRLSLVADDGGTVSGGGKYLAGKSIRVSASCNTGYDFVNWTNSKGEVVSTSSSFYYATTAENETLTAHFNYNPSSPGEPSDPILRHNITVATADGGTVHVSSNRLLEGASTSIWAYCNSGYSFGGWYVNGALYTTLPSFSYTMGKENVKFEAVFIFDPASPSEPAMPEDNKYAFYWMNVIGKPGDTLDVPLYLTSLDSLCDMTFQLTFSPGLMPDMEAIYMSSKAEGYTLSFTETSDSTYMVSMIGGSIQSGNTNLLKFKVKVADDCATGTKRQVKINQVSVTEPDGDHLTASTRNGLIAIYKKGDTNGDNVVNVTDMMNLVSHLHKMETEVFIKEVADVNEDSSLNVTDAMGIVNILIEEKLNSETK